LAARIDEGISRLHRRTPVERFARPAQWLALVGACFVGVALGACNTAGLDRAYTALDGMGARKRTAFFTDTASIWCDVDYSSGRADLTIGMRVRATRLWDDARHSMVPANAVLAVGEVVGQQGTDLTAGFEWQLLGPDGNAAPAGTIPYPVGDFVCDVTLDGNPVDSLPFSVSFPDCPAPPVIGGAACAGWVEGGSRCTDMLGRTCTCSAGAWEC
jgi:hypothetical protein